MRLQLTLLAVLLLAVTLAVAWRFMPPPLPKVVRLGIGPADGQYERFGEALAEVMARDHISFDLVRTSGSMENLRLLRTGEIDVGLVQSGNLLDGEVGELTSAAAVFYELVLVVVHSDWGGDHVEGGRVAIGVPGSGGHALALQLLADQGVRDGVPAGTRLVEIGDEPAVDALLAHEVDSGLFVAPLEADWVPPLFADRRLEVVGFPDAEAFTRHYRFLRRLVIPAGLLDLQSSVPHEDVEIVATTTSLVIGPKAHRALIPLMIHASEGVLRGGTLLAAPGHFPSGAGVDAPLAEEARRYFENGPSFLYRWLPFRWAFSTTRLAVVLIPLLTVLYPLYRSVRPAYQWAIERRVYRWYRVLKKIELRIDACGDAETVETLRGELDRMGAEIRSTKIPVRFASRLFALRAHHQQLVARLDEAEERVRLSSR